ncbi:MAG: hypothetical protein U0Y68_13445 [Blastocatellia bacterium]
MKLQKILEYAQKKYNVTFSIPEEVADQEWTEIQGYDELWRYTMGRNEYILLHDGPAYRFNINGEIQEKKANRLRLFIPEKEARKLFRYEEAVLPTQAPPVVTNS